MCVDRNRQADPLQGMTFITLEDWNKQIGQTYPFMVQVDPMTEWPERNAIFDWLVEHVGSPYDTWVNEHPVYRFQQESDAIKFSLTWS